MTAVNGTPLFLSRLILNPFSRQVRAELAQSYEMHRTLLRAFPVVPASDVDKSAREKFSVLFRVDQQDSSDRVTLYVQSSVPPDWSFLDALPDYLLRERGLTNPASKNVLRPYNKLQEGEVLSFRLRANPTKRIAKDGDPLKGKRVELTREEDQIDWLIRKGKEREKGKPGGFELLMKEVKDRNGEIRKVPSVNVRVEGRQTGRKSEGERRHELTHLAVRFDGVLRITDAGAFRETLGRGLGPGKAFGFGLLSVAPLSSPASEGA